MDSSSDGDYALVQTPMPSSSSASSTPVPDLEEGPSNTRASLLTLLLLSAPRLAASLAWAAHFAAFGPYLQSLLPPEVALASQIVGPCTGILVAPVVGFLSDKSTSKCGRRRPFLVFGASATIICWILIGFTRHLGGLCGDSYNDEETQDRHWTAFFTVVFYTWMDVALNMMTIPSHLLIADFAGDRQITGAALGQGASVVGHFLVALYIALFGPAAESLYAFLGSMILIMAICIGLVGMCVEEIPFINDKTAGEQENPKFELAFEALSTIFTGYFQLPHQLKVFYYILALSFYGVWSVLIIKPQFFGAIVYNGDPDGAATCMETHDCTAAQEAFNEGFMYASGVLDVVYNAMGLFWVAVLPLLVSRIGIKFTMSAAFVPQILFGLMALAPSKLLSTIIIIASSLSLSTIFVLMVPTAVEVLGPFRHHHLGVCVGALNSAICLGQIFNLLVTSFAVKTEMQYRLPLLINGVIAAVGCSVGVLLFKVSKNQYEEQNIFLRP